MIDRHGDSDAVMDRDTFHDAAYCYYYEYQSIVFPRRLLPFIPWEIIGKGARNGKDQRAAFIHSLWVYADKKNVLCRNNSNQ